MESLWVKLLRTLGIVSAAPAHISQGNTSFCKIPSCSYYYINILPIGYWKGPVDVTLMYGPRKQSNVQAVMTFDHSILYSSLCISIRRAPVRHDRGTQMQIWPLFMQCLRTVIYKIINGKCKIDLPIHWWPSAQKNSLYSLLLSKTVLATRVVWIVWTLSQWKLPQWVLSS